VEEESMNGRDEEKGAGLVEVRGFPPLPEKQKPGKGGAPDFGGYPSLQ
jgi:hypothetical protein